MSNPNALHEVSDFDDIHADPMYQALDLAQNAAPDADEAYVGWDYLAGTEYSVTTPDRWVAETYLYQDAAANGYAFAADQQPSDPVETYAAALERAEKFFANEGMQESVARVSMYSADLALRGTEAVFDTIATRRMGELAASGYGIQQ